MQFPAAQRAQPPSCQISTFHFFQRFPYALPRFPVFPKPDCAPVSCRRHKILHRNRHTFVKIQILRYIANFRLGDFRPMAVCKGNLSFILPFSQQSLNQRCFPRTVLADKGCQLSAVERQIYVFQQNVLPAGYTNPFHFNAAERAVAVYVCFHSSAPSKACRIAAMFRSIRPA